jgi:hypothetical protein
MLFAGCFCDQEAAVARGAVQEPSLVRIRRLVLGVLPSRV